MINLRTSLIISMIGISILLVLLLMPAKSLENIDESVINSKVIVEGQVEEERNIGELKIFTIDGLEVVCRCSGVYLRKNLRVEGLVGEFNGKRQIRALKISILD